MAVLTFGDIIAQCQDITGIRTSEDRALRALKAGINTAHTKVVNVAIAEGFAWAMRFDVQLTVTATHTGIALPDGTTVTDVNGVIPAACLNVREAWLGSQTTPLPRRRKDAFERENGLLGSIGRNNPMYWDHYGYNAAGQDMLWLMPYSPVADVVHLDYVAGPTFLTSDAQTLVPPVFARELVCQEAIAAVNARDTVDASLVAAAQQTARFLWATVYAISQQNAQRSGTIQQYTGQAP